MEEKEREVSKRYIAGELRLAIKEMRWMLAHMENIRRTLADATDEPEEFVDKNQLKLFNDDQER